jgi:DNA-binding NarL/FixJ family response regulator
VNPIRILLVDDQALFREGLRAVLSAQPDFEIVGEAANGAEAVALAKDFQPHVILMDLRMPGVGGVEATRSIRAGQPAPQIIILTTFDEDEDVFDALRAGAAGYLLKDATPEKLGDAIRAAARGESFLQPSIAAKVVAEFNRLSQPRPTQPHPALREPLSNRECQILQKLTEGKSNKEIAGVLNLAEGTVKNHLSNIFGKLGVLDRTQAALMARELGLL